jgi:hypothetical protein
MPHTQRDDALRWYTALGNAPWPFFSKVFALTAANELAVGRAMEAAGIKFIGENGGPRGRLKTGHSAKILSPSGVHPSGWTGRGPENRLTDPGFRGEAHD